MAEDRVTPPPDSPEDPILEISSAELAAEITSPREAAAPVPPPPMPPPPAAELELPPAPAEPHHDDQEVILVQEPAAPEPVAPAAEAPPAPVSYQPPPPPVPAFPEQPPAPPAPAEAQPVPPAAYAPAGEQLPTPVMASDEWYTSSGGQVYGPYPASDLRAWLQSGQMSWDTPASRGEGDPWRPLSAIAEFNPAPVYGVPVPGAVVVPGAKDKTIAGILAIVLGVLGAHHWYLGNYALAGIYLGITVLFGWTVIFHGGVENLLVIVSIVEGIIYLTASEDKFQRNYNRWFLNGP